MANRHENQPVETVYAGKCRQTDKTGGSISLTEKIHTKN